ncbi:tetratricopeptide repeat protein [Coprobacter tertius]|uniref:Tetratricopeptide repeat protein n=1 Tax=Coprobacter tertius TaxID=2944915 RepID=A0ABT1MGI9_9BACT|nr:tetratricopeptide repeat protein [Coprobacter tertius]MCP9611154.1 tetratricopeptide repeat protein [Coprobacter tertius]
MSKKYLRSVFFVFCLLSSPVMMGQSQEEARALYKEGKYAEAKPIFESLIKRNPSNASLNQWYGVCLYETGYYDQSEKYLKLAASKKIQDAYLYLGNLYFRQYRFKDALDNYEKYQDALRRSKGTGTDISERMEQARKGEQMLRRVEKVQIIDSMIIDKPTFFSHYKLSPESGKLFDYNQFFGNNRACNNSVVYQNQRGDKILYGHKTAQNGYDLFSRSRLVNDSWGEEIPLSTNINTATDQNYPFVLSDGVTLYYASTGDESLGGYDIFVTRLNLNTGNYLDPENLGMPFNSPFNDYMMAIDEINNVGWFVSDRYQPEGKLVLYIFIPNSEKIVYQGEDEEMARRLGRITSIKDTWVKGTDYKQLLNKIFTTTNQVIKEPKNEFHFIINNQIVYTRLSDFESKQARDYFLKSQDLQKQITDTENKLASLRKSYVTESGNKNDITAQINTLETTLLKLYGQPESFEAKSRAEEINQLLKMQGNK